MNNSVIKLCIAAVSSVLLMSGCQHAGDSQAGSAPYGHDRSGTGIPPVTPDFIQPRVVRVADLPQANPATAPQPVPSNEVSRPDGIIPESQAAQLRAQAANTPPNPNIQVLPSPDAPSQQRGGDVPEIVDGFDATQFFNSVPPDNEFTAGINFVIGVTNGTFEILDKDGVSQSGAIDYDVFFASDPNCVAGTFDPNAYFDEEEERYIVGTAGAGVYCFAVSQSEDLSGGGVFNLYSFSTVQDGVDFFDFPHMGVGNEALFMGANIFRGVNFDRADVWAIDKFAAYNGDPLPVPVRQTLDATADTPQPMTIHGAAQGTLPEDNTHYFITDFNFNGDTFSLYSWSDPFDGNGGTLVNTGAFDLGAFTGVTAAFPLDQPQMGGDDIQGNDWRPQDNEYRNGFLWMAHNLSCNPGGGAVNCVRWAQIDPNDGAGPIIIQSSVISVDGEFLSFPDVGVNHCDDMTIGFSRTSSTSFPGAYISGRLGDDPLNMVRPIQELRAGEEPYVSFEGMPPRRWGDYSEATSDPDGIRTWFLGEYSSASVPGSTNWATWVGEMQTDCEVVMLPEEFFLDGFEALPPPPM